MSAFWFVIVKLEPIGHMSTRYEPGIQTSILFWHDRWFDNCTLTTKFPKLNRTCLNKEVFLSEYHIFSGAMC